MHAEIADVEICRLRVVTKAAGLRHDRDVHAGLAQFTDIFNRNVGDASAIGLPLGRETSEINAFSDVAEIVQLVEPHSSVKRRTPKIVCIIVTAGAVFFLALLPV